MHDPEQCGCPEFGGEVGCGDELSFWAVCDLVLVPQTLKILLRIRHVFDLADAN